VALVEEAQNDDGRTAVRLTAEPARGRRLAARSALPGYQPHVGDRVLLVGDGDDAYICGVLHSTHDGGANSLTLDDGSQARSDGDALELHDAEGRLLLRYRQGALELCAPSGDLELSAPQGHLKLRSALDVTVEAQRDLHQRAGRRLSSDLTHGNAAVTLDAGGTCIEGRALRTKTDELSFEASRLSTVAHQVRTTAKQLVHNVERYELTTDRLVETSRVALREVAGLLQTRAGRVRQLVENVYTLRTRRTVMASKEDTRVDGRKILLG
jgi:hypothetical protein